MGLPTHRNETIRAILQRRWSAAHKNWAGGFPEDSAATALDGETAVEDGGSLTRARVIDALGTDRIARSQGATDGDSVSSDGDDPGSKGV